MYFILYCSTPNLDLKIRLRAPYVAPLNILQCLCLKALRDFQEKGTYTGEHWSRYKAVHCGST